MKVWTDYEKQYLTDKWANTTAEVIGNHLGKTRNAVCGMATKMGLKKSKSFMATRGKKWTPEQLADLKKMSKTKTVKQISEITGRSRGAIQGKLWHLGLTGKQLKSQPRPDVASPKTYKTVMFKVSPIKGTVSLRDIKPKQCRYVTDTGADMMLCGAVVVQGRDYCASCCDVVYQDFGKKRDLNVKPMGRLD